MKLKSLLCGAYCTLLVGCVSSGFSAMKHTIDVEIVNHSSRVLKNAQAKFGPHTCKWGVVIREATKGYGFYPHPITADAELHWDEVSGHRMEKIDLRKIYPPGKSGRLTFTIYDDRVEAAFREKPIPSG